MRISELAHTSGVALPTVKYYLREGLLPPGRPTAATQAEYGPQHLARLKLIRALVDVGGLSLAAVRAVLAALDAGPEQLPLAIGTAHDLLGPPAPDGDPPPEMALAALAELGWHVDPRSASLRQLDAALRAVESVGITADRNRLQVYARAALEVAELDIDEVPSGATDTGTADAVAYVVLGTVLYEPVLLALRRLAQQHVFAGRVGPGSSGSGSVGSGSAGSGSVGSGSAGPAATGRSAAAAARSRPDDPGSAGTPGRPARARRSRRP
jgi:DNA-binding transcriptional MerR regulator